MSGCDLMIKSMTGYGRFEATVNDYRILVEMKSVNHRYCEIAAKLPRSLLQLEEKIKKVIQEQIQRGRVDVYISIYSDSMNKKKLVIDRELVKAYQEELATLKAECNLQGELSIQDIIHIEHLFQLEEEELDVEQLGQSLLGAVQQATEALYKMRLVEGSALALDVKERIERIQQLRLQVELHAPKVVELYQERIEARIREFLAHRAEIDEGRLLTEVAVFAERSNIDEELTRLESHCQQFLKTLQASEPVGRKLDFIVQEMNREMNTIGSKANDITISQLVVELKSELEKIKEQVQNIE